MLRVKSLEEGLENDVKSFYLSVRVAKYTIPILKKLGFSNRVALSAVRKILKKKIASLPEEDKNKKVQRGSIASLSDDLTFERVQTKSVDATFLSSKYSSIESIEEEVCKIKKYLRHKYFRKIKVNKKLIEEEDSLYQGDLLSEVKTKLFLEQTRLQNESMKKINIKRDFVTLATGIISALFTFTFFAGIVPLVIVAIPAVCALAAIGMNFLKPKQIPWGKVALNFDIFKGWIDSDGNLGHIIDSFMESENINLSKYQKKQIIDYFKKVAK